MTSPGAFSFTPSERMVNWVHGNATVMRLESAPSHTASFTPNYVFVFEVAHLTDGGPTFFRNNSHFA
jgi:hypothetical protein